MSVIPETLDRHLTGERAGAAAPLGKRYHLIISLNIWAERSSPLSDTHFLCGKVDLTFARAIRAVPMVITRKDSSPQ